MCSIVKPNMKGARKQEGKGMNGRSSEKRRERSKVAARCRRSQESEIFTNLGICLPVPESTRTTLDKASIMRLSLCDLKLRDLVTSLFKNTKLKNTSSLRDSSEEFDSSISNAIGGFVIVISADGDITYVSESIVTHLGLAQCELMGQSIYDFSHPCDHADIRELLANKTEDIEDIGSCRSGCFRLKCTLTSRGRSVHIRSASYKVINCVGRMFCGSGNSLNCMNYVGICEPLPHPSDVDIPLNKQTFLSRHNPDMICEYIDDSVETFLRYRPDDLIGKSIFKFHHAADSQLIGKSYKSLFIKGQTQTDRYRFLAKHGGWIWVVTQATVLNDASWLKPTAVVCLHFVTSEIEHDMEIVSDVQLHTDTINKTMKPTIVKTSKEKSKKVLEKENVLPLNILNPNGLSSPIPSTKKIFAPRTDDMDSGFLMPSDDNKNTPIFSKDEEPEDLTHLAPIAGDDCVSLNVPLLDDLLKSFDQSKLEYSVNGFEIDVNATELPLVAACRNVSDIPNENLLSTSSNPTLYQSPLFLNSDPLMGHIGDHLGENARPYESSEVSPIDHSSVSNGSPISTSISSLCATENISSTWMLSEELPEILNTLTSSNSLDNLDPDNDNLDEYAPASDIPWTNNNFQTPNLTPLLSKSGLTLLNFNDNIRLGQVDECTERSIDSKCKVFRPCIDIERGDNTKLKMDILKILGERKFGDFPKVVTSIIFGGPEPPAKLKRTGFLNPFLNPDRSGSLELMSSSRILPGVSHGETYREPSKSEASRLDGELRRLDGEIGEQTFQLTDLARKRNSTGQLLGQDSTFLLSELTRQDYEMNAPLEDSCLLQGQDLITALENENSNDSSNCTSVLLRSN